MVIFVNYDDIKKEIEEKIPLSQPFHPGEKGVDNNTTWFYSSDYSDIL